MAGAKKSFTTIGGDRNNPSGNANRIAEANAKMNYNLQFIPYEKLYTNKLNKGFSQDDIEELSTSIKTWGLFHNLVVVKDAEKDMYRIISGERRWRAIGLMTQDERKNMFPAGIPAKIENPDMDDIDEEIRLREANNEREYSEADYRDNVLRLVELYKIKQQKGETPNLAKAIAEKTKKSERQIQKYINTEKLIPGLDKLFKDGVISLNYADKFSALPEDHQQFILSLYETDNTANISEDYKALKKNADEQREENKRLKSELEKVQEELKNKESSISSLKNQIENVRNIPYEKKDQDEIITELTEARDRAERAQKHLKEKLDNLELQQKELKNRNISISQDELKKIHAITKTEQVLESMEEGIKTLKSNKQNILSDKMLKERIRIFISRLEGIIEE